METNEEILKELKAIRGILYDLLRQHYLVGVPSEIKKYKPKEEASP